MIARFRAAGMKSAGIVACAVLAAALGARAQNAGTDPIYTDAAARAQAGADAAQAEVDAARRAAANQSADVKVDAAVLARLAAKADQAVDVTLDQPMLQAASAFLNAKDPKQVEAKKLVAKLQGVYVHNYEFSKPGEYSAADVQSLRAPFQGGAWSRAVNVQSKRDAQNVEVYMKKGDGKIQGLVVIAVEPQQVTFVHIMGAIEPQDLANLSGQFGIPPLRIGAH